MRWDFEEEEFEKELHSGNKKNVMKKLFQNEEKFSYFWELQDIPDNLKWGVEIEVGDLQLEKIIYFYKHNLIGELMNVLQIPKSISKTIIKNSVFEQEKKFSKWNFTKEANYDDSEASSPIFQNSLDSLNQINAVCTVFKALGGKATEKNAVHINLGVDYFECNKKALKNLLKIWGESEEIFYKMAAPEGKIIRKMAKRMASPVKGNIQDFLEEDGSVTLKTIKDKNKFLDLIQGRNRDEGLGDEKEKLRWTSVNFNHLGISLKNPGRIELRIFNSSLEPEIIFQDLLLGSKLFEVSLKTAKDTNYKKQEFQNLLRRDISEKEKVNYLLDLMFNQENQKKIFRKRWESVKDNPEYKKYQSGEDTFIR